MPKSRSSGTIANRGSESNAGRSSSGSGLTTGSGSGSNSGGSAGAGGGIGTGGSQEMSTRIDERLNVARTVAVEVGSRTRGRMENVLVHYDPATPGMATVDSPSGRTYTVDTEGETCTCPDYRYRRTRCRHIEAAAIAQEQIPQGIQSGSAEAIDINVNETLREHIENEAELERYNAECEFVDDGHFYADNIEEFEEDFVRLGFAPIPYEYENVLNGSSITFGIELEFVDGDSNAIARELYNIGLCSSPNMEDYYHRYSGPKWILKDDCSVTYGQRGGELVSPILRDTPETWKKIETICEVARKHGAKVDWRTGAHVHVSVEPLDGKGQRWKRLFKAFKGSEEAVFRFSGGEQGRFERGGYSGSAVRELNKGISARFPEEGSLNDFRSAIYASGVQSGRDRDKSLNVLPFTDGRPTIEVRAFNGTLTPGIIQANVKLATGLVHTAERSRIQGENEGPTTESFSRRGMMINDHEDSNTQDNNAIVKLVDTFFSRKGDKEHILSVMARNQWRD